MAEGAVERGRSAWMVRFDAGRGVLRSRPSLRTWRAAAALLLLAVELPVLLRTAAELAAPAATSLRCARAEGLCTLQATGEPARRFPLDDLQSVQLWPEAPGSTRAVELRLRTGALALWPGRPPAELQEVFDSLVRFLQDPAAPAWSARLRTDPEPAFHAILAGLRLLGTAVWAVVLPTWLLGWSTRLDLRRGVAVRWARGLRGSRPLGEFRGVRVRSGADAHLEDLALRGRARGFFLPGASGWQVALVDAAGRSWPISRHVPRPPAELDALAAQVAALLGLPLAPPPPHPAPGTVPAAPLPAP